MDSKLMPQGSPTVVFIRSSKNVASTNIAERLVEKHGFTSTRVMFMGRPVFQKDSFLLATIDTEIVNPPNLDEYFNPQAFIFLSSHRAESGIPSLTVHTTGNFSKDAALGGRPRELEWVNPDLMKNYLISLSKRQSSLKDYQITIEATHHGPTSLQKPVLFVELGSSEKNWGDQLAAGVVAAALMESLTNAKSWDRVAIAFGGTHYPEKCNNVLLESDLALASVAAKYSLEGIDGEMFGQMIQKSTKFPRFVAADWKGMGRHKERILGLAQQFGLEVIKL